MLINRVIWLNQLLSNDNLTSTAYLRAAFIICSNRSGMLFKKHTGFAGDIKAQHRPVLDIPHENVIMVDCLDSDTGYNNSSTLKFNALLMRGDLTIADMSGRK
ncbi:hypothetical protein EZJ58_3602 [Sodalis ligni]|uniref:Uncharacterized protein n=1 Tax=Sodalis ligni TaxID=2697027 RepID=A0A4R1NHU8_9GAMM|nr:hypothetical protein EZJ58_3602 [Sodalis ligni]